MGTPILSESRPADMLQQRDSITDSSSTSTLTAAALGFFIVTLDAVVINVALPSIRHDFGGGISGLQWVVDGYTLMFAALLLWSGTLTDRIGARRAFRTAVCLFIAASAACGVAPSLTALVIARFIQGSAAAVMMPSSMALISQAYPDPARRARAIAVWATGGAVASTSGPVLGGLFTIVSWRLIFFVNVPVGVVATILAARGRQSWPQRKAFDWFGQGAAVLAMGALTYGAIEAGAEGFSAPRVVVAFVVALLAVVTFLAVESHSSHPMVPLELFRSRNVSVSVAVGFAFVVGYYGLPFVMSLYLQQLRGLSPLGTGLVFLPMMLVGASLTPFSARLAERFGARMLITGGLVLMAGGLAVLASAPISTPTWILSGLMILVGLAGPFVSPPVTAVLLNSIRDHQAGIASGVFNTSRQIGGALAVAIFGALLTHNVTFMRGLSVSLLIASVVALASAAAALFLRPVGRQMASASGPTTPSQRHRLAPLRQQIRGGR